MKLDLPKLNKLFGISDRQEVILDSLTYKSVDFSGCRFLLNILEASACCNLKLTNDKFDIVDLYIDKVLEINCDLEKKIIYIKQKDYVSLFKVLFDPYISIQMEDAWPSETR